MPLFQLELQFLMVQQVGQLMVQAQTHFLLFAVMVVTLEQVEITEQEDMII